jgi:transposase
VLPFSDSDDPQLPFDDPTQQRYERIRPVVVIGNRTATERARETGMHPETVGRFKRRFEQQGMLGLIPDMKAVVPARRRRRVPDEMVEELRRLKGLYDGFGYRELARIILYKFNYRMSHSTIKSIWHQLHVTAPQQLPLLDYHSYPERVQARKQVIELYFQGWNK